MNETKDKIDRRQIRCFVDDADWIEDEVKRRERLVGRRKVWPADVVRDAVDLLRSKEGAAKPAAPAPSEGMGLQASPEQIAIARMLLRGIAAGDVVFSGITEIIKGRAKELGYDKETEQHRVHQRRKVG